MLIYAVHRHKQGFCLCNSYRPYSCFLTGARYLQQFIKSLLTFLSWVENQKVLSEMAKPCCNDKFNMHRKYMTVVLLVSESGMPERPLVDNFSNGYYDNRLEYWICYGITQVLYHRACKIINLYK